MRDETELLQALRDATVLIARTIDGDLPVQAFIEKYGNFYYYEALDGHEEDAPGKRLLSKYRKLISLHEAVQTSVVDLTYVGPDEQLQQYLDAGRITVGEAAIRLKRLAQEHALEEALADCQGGT